MDERIVALESQILRLETELETLKNASPRVVDNFTFLEPGGTVSLVDLFGGRREMLVVHNMGASCAYCTAYADGFNGILPHLLDRAAFVVVSPDPPDKQSAFAISRGWRFRMVSSSATSFSRDMGFEQAPTEYWPGAIGLSLDADGRKIVRTSFTSFDPGDKYSPIWPLMALLGSLGTKSWVPRIVYKESQRADRRRKDERRVVAPHSHR